MTPTLATFLIAKWPELALKTWQHIYLSGLATLIAIIIGVPLGILAIRHPKIKAFILGFAGILQTIPSLALLAFLLPFLGIGVLPAIVALAVYAILPIVRNTVTGLENISPEFIEAANGLGFTYWQKLRMVELPLALPTIIAGIRTATIMSIGITTIAAFIGAGGLGDFIFQGISLNDNRLVLLGAIPAALLALLFDFLIATLEKSVSRRHHRSHHKALIFTALLCCLGLLMFTVKNTWSYWQRDQNNIVRIATKNFTEQYILGYLIADMIEAHTRLTVEKKFNLGPTDICQRAMLKGEIDIYPEYTGTAYAIVLKQTSPGTAEQVYADVKSRYQQQFNIIWLAPFGFNDTQALVVKDSLAAKHGLNTIRDLVPLATGLTIGVPPEFMERPDAFPGLKKAYGLNFATIRQMDPGLMYQAINNREVDVILGFSTDARIPYYHLKILADNQHFFPPYYAAPLIRASVLKAHPEIATALQPLANLINDDTMRKLNYKVEVQKQSPESVAKAFLIQHKLL